MKKLYKQAPEFTLIEYSVENVLSLSNGEDNFVEIGDDWGIDI